MVDGEGKHMYTNVCTFADTNEGMQMYKIETQFMKSQMAMAEPRHPTAINEVISDYG